MLRHALESDGHDILEVRDQSEATRALQEQQLSLVLTDLRLPEGDGFGVLRLAKEIDDEMPVIVMTAYGTLEDAVRAMKDGALDFLAKPVDPDHLQLLVRRALEQRRIVNENLLLKEELAVRRGAPQLVGEDPALRKVFQSLQRAAATDTTVLIEGESGTGKELFARSLHALSERTTQPFVAINCAAIPETLLETELFGHEKGAFTGAVARKPGKFEMAHRGTLFLDEIGDLPLSLQAKILRLVQEKQFERVGGLQTITVDVRVVAATNRDLRDAVARREFREDLFFRLSVFPVEIPPLRRRRGDIRLLAEAFLERYAREMGRRGLRLSDAAYQALQNHSWPGNVRELQNAIERAAILADGNEIEPSHLRLTGEAVGGPRLGDVLDLSGPLADVGRRAAAAAEDEAVRQALLECRDDRTEAAARLGITLAALGRRLRGPSS